VVAKLCGGCSHTAVMCDCLLSFDIAVYASLHCLLLGISHFKRLTFNLVKEALIEIGCVVTSLIGCHVRALWPNGAS